MYVSVFIRDIEENAVYNILNNLKIGYLPVTFQLHEKNSV